MGRLTRYRALPDSGYDPRVTDLSRPLNVPGSTGPQAGIPYTDPSTGAPATVAGGPGQGWKNNNVSNTIPIQLVAGVSTRALPNNPKRTGLLIQNKDPTSTLNVSFGNDLQGLGLNIGPGGYILLDFTTTPDPVYLFCAGANIQTIVVEFSRSGS
jgi:hypothetical protein